MVWRLQSALTLTQYSTSTVHVSPTTPTKPKQVAFILSEEEHAMLHELAALENRSIANWLRTTIRAAHEALPTKKPKAVKKK